jgi:predicted PurR-regulated permease PerM
MVDNKLVKTSIVFLAVVAFAIVLKTLESFLRPFTIAILLTFLLMPLVRLSIKKKIPFAIPVILVLILLVVIIGYVGNLFTAEIIEYNKILSEKGINSIVSSIKESTTISVSDSKFNLLSLFTPQEIADVLTTSFKSIFQAITAFLSQFLLVILFMIFLIPSHERFVKDLKLNYPKKEQLKVESAIFEVENKIAKYLILKSLISLLTAVISAIVLVLFGSKYVILFALLIFILNFIPNLGSILAVIIILISFSITTGFTMNLLWLGILLTLIQLFIGNYLDPLILGESLKLSPLIILLSLFLWYWIWGIIGMFIAVPITVIIKIILENNKSTKKLAKLMV